MGETKDIWDIVKIIGTIVSTTLIPITIFIVGQILKKQKDKSDVESRQIDKISQFLKHLTSENENERIVALKVSKYLYSINQLPGELISAVETLSITDEMSGALAEDVLKKENKTEENFWQEIKDIFDNSGIALGNYISLNKKYKYIKEISELNKRARNLFLINNRLIPSELRQSVSELVRHYNDWLSGYNKYLAQLQIEPDDNAEFNYLAAPNYLFPRKSVDLIQEYINKRNSKNI